MFVVFDLETTGLSKYTDDVIEFSYILFDNNNQRVKSEQLYFYYEGMSWSDEAFAVHQIPLEFLETHKDKFQENLCKMYSVLNCARIVGHNSTQFDGPFAQQWLQRMGISKLRYTYIHDTMLELKPLTKRARIKLSKLAVLCGITPEAARIMLDTFFPNNTRAQYHDAAYDTTVTALITLFAIKNGYMSMEPNAVRSYDIDVDASDLSIGAQKKVDPNRYIVILKDFEEDDEEVYHFVNHDYEAYADSVPTDQDVALYKSHNLVFPLPLVRGDSDSNEAVYTGEYNEIMIKFSKDKFNGDMLMLSTAYGTILDTQVKISTIIEKNFSSYSN